jgi:hypothetical protein
MELESLVNKIRLPIAILTEVGNVLHWSSELQAFLGIEAKNAIQTHFINYVSKTSQAEFFRAMGSSLLNEFVQGLQINLIDAKGYEVAATIDLQHFVPSYFALTFQQKPAIILTVNRSLQVKIRNKYIIFKYLNLKIIQNLSVWKL